MGRYKEPYSLYKRGKYYYYRTYTPAGVRTTAKSTGKKTKQEARAFCENLYLIGRLYSSEVLFIDFSRGFYDDSALYWRDRVEPASRNTVKNYQRCYNLYILPYFKNTKIAAINYTMLKTFRADLIKREFKSGTITCIMSVLKHIIEAAYRDNIINENPFIKLEPLQMRQQERDAFTLEECRLIYKTISAEFKNIILLMAVTGLRISEAIGVRPEDIKTTSAGLKYIDLQQQLNNKKYTKLKGKEARPVPVCSEAVELIGFDPSRLSALYREFEPIKIQLKDYERRLLAFHSLRHFFITSAKSSGLIESKVEFVAGHKLKHITAVYTNYKADDLAEFITWQQEIIKQIKA